MYLHYSESTCYCGSYSHLLEHDLSINSIAKSNFIYNHQVPLALKINSTHTPLHLSPRNQLSMFWLPLILFPSLHWDGTIQLTSNCTKLAHPCSVLTKLSYSIILKTFTDWLHNKWTRYCSPLLLKKNQYFYINL